MSLSTYGSLFRKRLRGYGRQILQMETPVWVHPRELLQRQKNIVIGGSNKVGKTTFIAGLRELLLAQGGTTIELIDMKHEPLWKAEADSRDVIYHYPEWGELKLAPKGSPQFWALRSECREEDYRRAEDIMTNLRREPHSSVQELIANLRSGKVNVVGDMEFLKIRNMLGGGEKNDVQKFLSDFFTGLYRTEKGVKYANVFYDEAQGEVPSKKGVSQEGQTRTSNIVGASLGKFASYLGRFVFSTFNLTRLAGPLLDITHYFCLFQIPLRAAMGELELYYDAVHLLPPHVFTLVRNDSRFTPHVSADLAYRDHYPDLVHFEELHYPKFWVQPFPAIPIIPEAEAEDNVTMALVDVMRGAGARWSEISAELNQRVKTPINESTLKSQYRRWKKNRGEQPKALGDQDGIQGEMAEAPEA